MITCNDLILRSSISLARNSSVIFKIQITPEFDWPALSAQIGNNNFAVLSGMSVQGDCYIDFGLGDEPMKASQFSARGFQGYDQFVKPSEESSQSSFQFTIKVGYGCTRFKFPYRATKVLILDLSQMITCYSMFEGCTQINSIPALNGCPDKAPIFNKMFKGCLNLTELNGFKLGASARQCASMFEDCVSLAKLPEDFSIPDRVDNCVAMFKNCISLKEIPATLTLPQMVQNCTQMFCFCSELADSKNISFEGRRKLSSVNRMFMLTSLVRPGLMTLKDTSISNASQLFRGCQLVDIGDFRFGSRASTLSIQRIMCQNKKLMFLDGLVLTKQITNAREAFMDCYILQHVSAEFFAEARVGLDYTDIFKHTFVYQIIGVSKLRTSYAQTLLDKIKVGWGQETPFYEWASKSLMSINDLIEMYNTKKIKEILHLRVLLENGVINQSQYDGYLEANVLEYPTTNYHAEKDANELVAQMEAIIQKEEKQPDPRRKIPFYWDYDRKHNIKYYFSIYDAWTSKFRIIQAGSTGYLGIGDMFCVGNGFLSYPATFPIEEDFGLEDQGKSVSYSMYFFKHKGKWAKRLVRIVDNQVSTLDQSYF